VKTLLLLFLTAVLLAGCAVSRDMQTGETRVEGRLTIEDLEAINRIVRGKELPATRGYAK
jgi:hypothetical protein